MATELERMIILAGKYALDLLPVSEAAEIERLKTNPTFRKLLAEWRERLADLDDAAEPIQPSGEVWEAIVGQLKNYPKA